MPPITPCQKALFDFIKSYIAEKGVAPTYVEMVDAMDFKSKSRAAEVLAVLEKRGLIRRYSFTPRGIEILDHSKENMARLLGETLPYINQNAPFELRERVRKAIAGSPYRV